MKQSVTQATPDERIVHFAKNWRAKERAALAAQCNKADKAKYEALQKLRNAVDRAAGQP